ncbi:MAG TPA: AAA family ATPase [Candidatus Paceibacterota bacterium]|nr:AAA family ATPase [Candidatus Paceibacterota bacterium]
MTLKNIELASFKSFGRKSSVMFAAPITAIVGPNGSGKSNIVEAIRFVLGEQSMKSLRGKGGVDLIFKGSKTLPSANRALVSITFDNSRKIFSFTNSGLGIPLDYDEIVIGREVFSDGINRYSINGTEVRLKDIVDLLASVNIGSSGHHIISQGESDHVLNASNKDRRAMIEDALGLKIYQYRIRESERKIDKTLLNMKEAQMQRREIAPHLAFLKKQVQVIEKSRLMREELKDLYKTYFSNESTYINNETKRLAGLRSALLEQGLSLDEKISSLQRKKNENAIESEHEKQIKSYDNDLSLIREKKDDLARSLGRIEGIIEGLERQFANISLKKERVISESEWKSFMKDLESRIDEAIASTDLPNIGRILRNMKSKLSEFLPKSEMIDNKKLSLNENKEYMEMQNAKNGITSDLKKIKEEELDIVKIIGNLKQKEQESQSALRNNERLFYELLNEKNKVDADMKGLHFEEENLALIKNSFEIELSEAAGFVGREVASYARLEAGNEISRSFMDELRRKIERIKIKLEDAGSGSGSDVMKEYEDAEERDKFLAKEIDDLNKSIDSLKLLIQELKEKLDAEFKDGVAKINKQFQNLFSLMFGGGSAFISITMEHKRPRNMLSDRDESISEDGESNDADELGQEETELEFERGIEINVTLPKKKVKDLHMLSGGERSLTSIALLFAISQVNPPPFLVLDETDAALDESNSRKYGDMLLNLSKFSQLIVVTHNRETMSRANVLYGVTMGAEGASKLFSIHLEDASAYAK